MNHESISLISTLVNLLLAVAKLILGFLVNSAALIDCDDNDLFRFLSDLGELGAEHTHLQAVRDLISTIIMNIHGQGIVDYYSLRGKIPTGRLITILIYLEELGLVELNTDISPRGYTTIREVVVPPETLIRKAFITMEASSDWEEHREPNLILSYILIKGLNQTLEIIEEKGSLNVGEGITRLYVTKGRVYIPKQFTVPLVYILGSWSKRQDELTETDIKSFMALRGLTNRQRDKVVRLFAGAQIGLSHTIYRFERFSYGVGTQEYRLILNPRFGNLRDRLRGRFR